MRKPNGIIIHELKTVWFSIPKNASTTLKVHFANTLGIPFKNPHNVKFERTWHPVEGYFNFALVRNPYERLYSLWSSWDNVHYERVYNKYKGLFYKGMSYRDYVASVTSLDYDETDPHFMPQYLQIPKSVHVEKIEDNLLLKILGMHNSTQKPNKAPQDERIFNYYKEDFERFRYSKNHRD